jgi:hypothetical protein
MCGTIQILCHQGIEAEMWIANFHKSTILLPHILLNQLQWIRGRVVHCSKSLFNCPRIIFLFVFSVSSKRHINIKSKYSAPHSQLLIVLMVICIIHTIYPLGITPCHYCRTLCMDKQVTFCTKFSAFQFKDLCVKLIWRG